MSRIAIVILIYHNHKPTNHIPLSDLVILIIFCENTSYEKV
jgi:hypothetical protein